MSAETERESQKETSSQKRLRVFEKKKEKVSHKLNMENLTTDE